MSNLIFKYLILPLILILIAGAIFWWFVLDIWGNIQTAWDVIEKNQKVLVERQHLAENLKKLVAQYQERIQDVAKINQIVPSDPAIADLLVMLESLASENALQFTGVDFNLIRPVGGPAASQIANVTPAGLQVVQISAKVKGSYVNFLNYLKTIETNIRLLDTASVTFNVPPPAAGVFTAGSIEFLLVINAYYQ